MSFAAGVWARKQTVGNGIAKAVLIAIADRANDAGKAWPSQDLLADDTEFSLRAVRDALKHLEVRGFVHRKKRGAHGRGRIADLLTLRDPPAVSQPAGAIYRQGAPLNDLPAPHVDLPAPRAGEPIKNLYPSHKEEPLSLTVGATPAREGRSVYDEEWPFGHPEKVIA